MTFNARFSLLVRLALALTVGLAINLSGQLKAESLTTSPSSSIPDRWQPRDYDPPNDIGAPQTEVGSTRGICWVATDKFITPLAPKSAFATTSPYPTLFWYWPYTAKPATVIAVKFQLTDKDQNSIYEQDIPMPATPAIEALDIASFKANLPSLEVGKVYYWQLTPVCSPDKPDVTEVKVDYTVRSLIKRFPVNPSLASKIQQATPEERVALYANAGIWDETLTTLYELRRQNPNDSNLADAWAKLLTSANLDKFAKEPLATNP